jgi:hypothetical protein
VTAAGFVQIMNLISTTMTMENAAVWTKTTWLEIDADKKL